MPRQPEGGRNLGGRSTIRRLLGVLGVGLAGVFSISPSAGPAHAASWSDCQAYAERALAHQRENMNWRCGLSGPLWSFSYQQHFNWCRTVHINLAYQQSMRRLNALGLCKARYNRGGGGTPATDAQCRQYAATAVNQNATNLRLGCGFQGQRWSSDWNWHYRWCRSAGSQSASSEAIARGTMLRQCANRRQPARACAWRRFGDGSVRCVCVFSSNTTVTRIVPDQYCSGIRRY